MDKTNLILFQQQTERLENAYLGLQEKLQGLYQELVASQQTYEKIFTYISDGLIFIKKDGTISHCNPAAEKITGLQEVLGKQYVEFFSDTFFGLSIEEALAKDNFSLTSLLTLQKEPHSIDVEATITTIPEQGVVILLRDRSVINQLEKIAKRNDRLQELGQMAASLAHEIRNPLGGIEGYASLLASDLKETPNLKKMTDAILEGTKTLNCLVTSVLDYAKPCPINFARIDLIECVTYAISLLNPSKQSQIEFQSAAYSFFVSADRMHIARALLNIFQNALDASDNISKVKVVFDGKKELSIIDQGCGIAAENLELIFTPFFTTKAKGTGLGLAEVYKILDAHGWKISVDSNVGRGTKVTIELN